MPTPRFPARLAGYAGRTRRGDPRRPYVDDELGVPYGPAARSELAAQTGRALVHPVFFGSAAHRGGRAER